jgi:hypothetical protein
MPPVGVEELAEGRARRLNLAVCAEAQMLPAADAPRRGRRVRTAGRPLLPRATVHRINKTALYNLDMEKFSVDELRRLELALRPAEPPTVEEVLEYASKYGVLRGPVDWVFPAWIAYVEYTTQRIAETFQLTEEERRQLFHFRDAMKRLLLEAWRQAKEKLASIYKAVVDGTYRMEGNRLYAPDGTWMYVREGFAPRIIIHGVTAKTRFPDILKLPRERLELLQLGWRASDEGEMRGRPYMGTAQPWQVFAWTAARYGELYIRIASVILTREGVSVSIRIKARGWRQRWSKDEAIDLVASHLRRGEWTPVLTMWLGMERQTERRFYMVTTSLLLRLRSPGGWATT